jgi:hypothetical protein
LYKRSVVQQLLSPESKDKLHSNRVSMRKIEEIEPEPETL